MGPGGESGEESAPTRGQRLWRWLGLNLGKHAFLVGAIGLVVTLVLGAGLTRLDLKTGNASYLNRNDPASVDASRYQAAFGGDPILVMITMAPNRTSDDLFTTGNVAALDDLERRIAQVPGVFSVESPEDALRLAQSVTTSPSGNPSDSLAAKMIISAYQRDTAPTSRQLRLQSISAQLAEESKIPPAERHLTNPTWVHFLTHTSSGQRRAAVSAFLPNTHHAEMIAFLNGGLTPSEETRASRHVEQLVSHTHLDGATTLTTGVPEVLDAINSNLRRAFLILGTVAVMLMVLILVLAFGVRWRLLPLLIVSVGLIWAFGLAGLIGIPLTIAGIAGLPVLLGVGIDYAIQMHARIEEEVVVNHNAHPIQQAAQGLGPGLLVVVVDAALAFSALWFSQVPMVRQFGSLLVIGVVAICLCSLFGTLAILGIREYRSPTRRAEIGGQRLRRVSSWLGGLSPRTAPALVGVCAVVVVLGVSAEARLGFETDPISWLNQHATVVRNIDAVRAGTGADNEMGVMVTTDRPFTDATVSYVTKLQRQLGSRFSGAVYPPTGLVSFADQLTEVPGADTVAPTATQVEAVYQDAPEELRRLMATDHGRKLNIIFRARSRSLASLQPLAETVRSMAHPRGISATPGGIAIVGVGLIDALDHSRLLLTYLAVAFVGLFLAIRLRSVVRSLLSLVPVLIAVGSVSIVADVAGISLSPMTAVAAPLVVAACTEFTSLILLRFIEERRRGLNPPEAMSRTTSRTGRAFIVSGLTILAGTGTVALSPMPLLRGFGAVVTLNIGIALVSALVVLPPLIVWAERWQLVSRGLVGERARFAAPPSAPLLDDEQAD